MNHYVIIGFLRYRFGGLIFGAAYTWRDLFSEFYGIFNIRGTLMSRIDLVSKNLLANCFRSFSKKYLKKTAIRKVL